MLVALIDSKLPPPEILKIASTHKSLTIWGKTKPKNGVIFVFEETDKNSNTESLGPKVYTVWANDHGDFTLKEDTGVFSLPKGKYKVTAITYDSNTKTKSENGKVFQIEIKGSSIEWLFSSLDKILNILALLVILAGFLMTVLVS